MLGDRPQARAERVAEPVQLVRLVRPRRGGRLAVLLLERGEPRVQVRAPVQAAAHVEGAGGLGGPEHGRERGGREPGALGRARIPQEAAPERPRRGRSPPRPAAAAAPCGPRPRAKGGSWGLACPRARRPSWPGLFSLWACTGTRRKTSNTRAHRATKCRRGRYTGRSTESPGP